MIISNNLSFFTILVLDTIKEQYKYIGSVVSVHRAVLPDYNACIYYAKIRITAGG